MMMRFTGKSVLITGAAGGLGRAAAERFAAEGARLILSDHPSAPLDAVATSIGGEVATLAGDVTDPGLHEALVALAVEKYGRLDVAVNNAGIANPVNRLPDIPIEEARQVIEVDLMGVFLAMRAQLPQMDRQFRETGTGGVIVNLSSVAGIAGAPTISIYAAAKHGVVGLTRSAAAEYARRGIRVNAICPAFTRTAMVEDGIIADMEGSGAERAAAEAHVVRGVPMRRLGEPDEIAQAILFAAAAENGFMTGQTIALDGGITAV
jgi:NAD(P)-dependent dehydrogenase (short-subunit alcohol dehydrogenase family)